MAAASAYARARNATLFHMIHAAFAIMLSRLSDTRDIVIGTPVSGRPSALLDEVVGMFVETVVLRTDVDPDARIDQFIDAVRMSDTAARQFRGSPSTISQPGTKPTPVAPIIRSFR